jgi:hypothetical protein
LNGRDVTAFDIATAADRLFLPDDPLDFNG